MKGACSAIALALLTVTGSTVTPCVPSALAGFCRVGCPGRPPTLIRHVEPNLKSVARPYPSGMAILELGINPDGRVISACVLRGVRSDFDKAAQTAAMQWRWTPKTIRGTRVGVALTVSVTAPGHQRRHAELTRRFAIEDE
jgi:TonB family protein